MNKRKSGNRGNRPADVTNCVEPCSFAAPILSTDASVRLRRCCHSSGGGRRPRFLGRELGDDGVPNDGGVGGLFGSGCGSFDRLRHFRSGIHLGDRFVSGGFQRGRLIGRRLDLRRRIGSGFFRRSFLVGGRVEGGLGGDLRFFRGGEGFGLRRDVLLVFGLLGDFLFGLRLFERGELGFGEDETLLGPSWLPAP